MTAQLPWHRHRVRDVVAVALTAALVEVGLRAITLPTLARWSGTPLLLDDAPSTPAEPVHLPPEAVASVRTVRAVMSRWPYGDTCLRVALVAGNRLRRWHPRLALGVQRVDAAIVAHAWLEIGGQTLDPSSASFAPLRRPATQ